MLDPNAGNPRALVFVHGGAATFDYWLPQIEHFARRYRVVAYVREDCGRSVAPPRELTYSRSARNLRRLVRVLGLERYAVIGHSRGQEIAAVHVSTAPPGLVGFVAEGTSLQPEPSPGALAEARAQVARHARGEIDLRREALAELSRAAPVVARGMGLTQGEALDVLRFACATWRPAAGILGGTDVDLRAALARIDVPMLQIDGAAYRRGRDRRTTMQRYYRHPRLELLPGVGHVPHLEAPEVFNQLVERFLATLTGDLNAWPARSSWWEAARSDSSPIRTLRRLTMEGTCVLCASDGEVVACLGCDVRAHSRCLEKLGCQTPTCPLLAVRGQLLMPAPGAAWHLARAGWVVAVACAIALPMRRAAEPYVSGALYRELFLASLAAACACTALAFARDRATPAGGVIARELEGRTLLFLGLLAMVCGVWARRSEAVLTGYLIGFVAAVWNGLRRGRRTHHPLREGFTMFDLYAVVSIIGIFAAIGIPGYAAARQRANTRACYANQKTIAGASEMYALDKTRRPLTEGIPNFEALRSGGYLQTIPQDPGGGPGTSSHYRYTANANGITCQVHGAIQ